jgi:hypothetical protein
MKNVSKYLIVFLIIVENGLFSSQAKADNEQISINQLSSNAFVLKIQGEYLICLHSKAGIRGLSISHGKDFRFLNGVKGEINLSIGDGVPSNNCHALSNDSFSRTLIIHLDDKTNINEDSFLKLVQLKKSRNYRLSINRIFVGVITILANGKAVFQSVNK